MMRKESLLALGYKWRLNLKEMSLLLPLGCSDGMGKPKPGFLKPRLLKLGLWILEGKTHTLICNKNCLVNVTLLGENGKKPCSYSTCIPFYFSDRVRFWVKENLGFGYPIPDTFRYMGKSREVSIVIYYKV